MDGKTTDIVRMSFESGDFFVCVVVENSELKVVAASYEPVFARDEFNTANGNIGDFESL